jgi:hypothetical protein
MTSTRTSGGDRCLAIDEHTFLYYIPRRYRRLFLVTLQNLHLPFSAPHHDQ